MQPMPTTRSLTRSTVGYLAGVVLGSMCLMLLFLGMRTVMDVGGACADGGPYVSAQPCPEGTALAMFGGIFGLFAAGGLMAWFGGRLGAGYVALIAIGWPALFISLGFNFLQYGIDPPGPSTAAEWGWLIPGVLFWLMGGIPLVVGLAGWRAARSTIPSRVVSRLREAAAARAPDRVEFAPNAWGAPRPAATETAGAAPRSESDVDEVLISQLERLTALHAAGGLTDDEFAVAKARILANERLDG